MSGRVVKKNPTQKFQYEKGMEVLAGKQFGAHMAHLRTSTEKMGSTNIKNATVSSNKQ